LKIYLLTHERELHKKSNTGQLVLDVLGDEAEIIVWRRKEPDLRLVQLLESGQAAMLYPDLDGAQGDGAKQGEGGENGENSALDRTVMFDISDFQNFVILDSTWQEARKMYNKSPYLKQAKKISLSVKTPSKYQLRRNQIEGGLSTAECVITLLKMQGNVSASSSSQTNLSQDKPSQLKSSQINQLQAKFENFNLK